MIVTERGRVSVVDGGDVASVIGYRAVAGIRRADLLWWMDLAGGGWTAPELAERTGLYSRWPSRWDRRDRCEADLRKLERDGCVKRTSRRPTRWWPQ